MNDPRLHGLAANPALPADLLDRLIAAADADLCTEIADRTDLTPAQVAALVARGGTGTATRLAYAGRLGPDDVATWDPEVALGVLDAGRAPAEWAFRLATDSDVTVRRRVPERCQGPAEVLTLLGDDPDDEVAAEVAHFAPMTAALAGRLASHPHADVRRALATNPTTPPPVLAVLARRSAPSPATRCAGCVGEPSDDRPYCSGAHEDTVFLTHGAAAENPATPSEAALPLAGHPDMWVRSRVAARADLPPAAYRTLAVDPAPGVRAALAENPAIGEAVMRTLADDGRAPIVHRRLAHNPAVPLDVLAGILPTADVGVTLLPRISAATSDEVAQLAASADPELRMLVATRRDLPSDIADKLAQDPDAKVLNAVAAHPGLSEQRLRDMVDGHGARVIAEVAGNPQCSAELLHHLADRAGTTTTVLRVIAAHPHASADTLQRCLDDPDERVRRAAAANPALPRDAAEALLR